LKENLLDGICIHLEKNLRDYCSKILVWTTKRRISMTFKQKEREKGRGEVFVRVELPVFSFLNS